MMFRKHWLTIGALIGSYLAIDIALPYVSSGSYYPAKRWLYWIFMGFCASQPNLIACWGAFAPGSASWRLACSGLLAGLAWCGLVGGHHLVVDVYFTRSSATTLGCVLLGSVVVAYLPLWIVRSWQGCRFYPPGAGSSLAPGRQFTVRQLFMVVTLCSCLLMLGRLYFPPHGSAAPDFNSHLTVVVAVVGTAHLLLALPCVWLALAPGKRYWRLALLGPWAILISFIAVSVAAAVFGAPPRGDEYLEMAIFSISQCVSVVGALLIVQLAGFRFEKEMQSHSPALLEVSAPPEDNSGSSTWLR